MLRRALKTLPQGLYHSRGLGWGGRWEGGSKGRGYMYTYDWFMLRFDRKQHSSVKQLSFNKKNENKNLPQMRLWLHWDQDVSQRFTIWRWNMFCEAEKALCGLLLDASSVISKESLLSVTSWTFSAVFFQEFNNLGLLFRSLPILS